MGVLRPIFLFIIGLFAAASLVCSGVLFWTHEEIKQAAKEGARISVAGPCAPCPPTGCGSLGAAYTCDDRVVDAVNAYLLAAKLDAGSVVPDVHVEMPVFCEILPVAPPGTCERVRGIRVCHRVLLRENPEECGTVVSFAYRINLPASLHLPSIVLSSEAAAAEE